MKTFKIGEIEIGGSARPIVIPEIGINHNGSLETAKEMVLSAHRTRPISWQMRWREQLKRWFLAMQMSRSMR